MSEDEANLAALERTIERLEDERRKQQGSLLDSLDSLSREIRRRNPTLHLAPDFFPTTVAQRMQMKAIRDEIYEKTGIWYDDLTEMMEVLHEVQAKALRSKFKVVKSNPRLRKFTSKA
jgi:septal ring factor EnvC (AmiA/AmiB activator)